MSKEDRALAAVSDALALLDDGDIYNAKFVLKSIYGILTDPTEIAWDDKCV